MANRFVLYLYVGELPKIKAEEYAHEVSKLFDKEEWLKPEEKLIIIPVRNGETHLEEFSILS